MLDAVAPEYRSHGSIVTPLFPLAAPCRQQPEQILDSLLYSSTTAAFSSDIGLRFRHNNAHLLVNRIGVNRS